MLCSIAKPTWQRQYIGGSSARPRVGCPSDHQQRSTWSHVQVNHSPPSALSKPMSSELFYYAAGGGWQPVSGGFLRLGAKSRSFPAQSARASSSTGVGPPVPRARSPDRGVRWDANKAQQGSQYKAGWLLFSRKFQRHTHLTHWAGRQKKKKKKKENLIFATATNHVAEPGHPKKPQCRGSAERSSLRPVPVVENFSYSVNPPLLAPHTHTLLSS